MMPAHPATTPNHRPGPTLLSEDPMRPYAPILATLTAVAIAVGFAPVAARTAAVPHGTTIHGGTAQGGILGRYVLRSVDGVNLPAPIPGEDPRHKLSVMDG